MPPACSPWPPCAENFADFAPSPEGAPTNHFSNSNAGALIRKDQRARPFFCPVPKPRLLIPISLQFSIRYLLRSGLIDRLRPLCDPVFLLAWKDTALERELEDLGEVHPLVKSQWGGSYERARAPLNAAFHQRMASPSTPIRDRRANLERGPWEILRRSARRSAHRLLAAAPGLRPLLERREEELLWTDTNAREVQRQLRRLRPDALFCLTPFIPDEELTARVCAMQGMPTCTSILSFDNLTTRSWIPVLFDSYLLWNRHNAAQLLRGYPEAATRDVTLVGTPQFDFYWDPRYLWSEDEWRRALGLPPDRPVLLFGGGYFSCAPHEPQFLRHLDEAITQHELPGDPLILFRRHPVDPIGRWEPILRTARNVIHDDPWEFRSQILGHTNVGHQDIAKLASTLQHTIAHINVASTMTLDGAILDRPQIGPAYDESPGGKYHRSAYECYQQEHFLPILHSGGLAVARGRRELVAAVRAAILDPAAQRSARRAMVREICTFDDGKCTRRVAEAAAAFLARHAAAPVRTLASD